MHDCIHRRFRKRLSKKEIKDKEAELERLLAEDKKALSTRFQVVDENYQSQPEDEEFDDGEDEEDALGEPDDSGYFGTQEGAMPGAIPGAGVGEDEPEIDEELEAELAELYHGGTTAINEAPAPQAEETPATATAGTPAAPKRPERRDIRCR